MDTWRDAHQVDSLLTRLQIRGDYQTVIVPKGSPLSHRPGQAQSLRQEGAMEGTVCGGGGDYLGGRGSLAISSFCCKHNVGSVALGTKNQICVDDICFESDIVLIRIFPVWTDVCM